MSAPAFVLVHGYPFDHSLWDAVLPFLDSDVQVLAPDLRGFGGLPVTDVEPSLERLAEDLKLLLDERQLSRAVVAGMSMGGYVALSFAEQYPERLAGLGLVSSSIWADTNEARAGRRAMIERVRREGAAVVAQAVVPKLFAQENRQRQDLIRFPEKGAEKAGITGITWALEAMARRPDRSAVFQSLGVPVLVLHGVQDQFTSAERAREMSRLPADARYVEIQHAGHATPLEAPAEVAEALNELVKRSVT
jgi:pimeloyl-ACP methyl ester carboxylesterase